jgi:hypothetical protein
MVHKLSEVTAFGERLIETGDLDPVYIALYAAQLPRAQMCRLLLAYFCFYHLGASAYISEYEGHEFWEVMEQAAENQMPPSGTDSAISFDRWPRGAERRHFRGDKCVDAVKRISELGRPESLIDSLVGVVANIQGVEDQRLSDVMTRAQAWPMFGPWIAFKVADMLERILGASITFPIDLTLIYKEPRAALDMLDMRPEQASSLLLEHFDGFLAPPSGDRYCNIQEVETVLCKWKSWINGHYWVGKDIHEVRHGLVGWGETASKLLACMPKEVERGLFQ